MGQRRSLFDFAAVAVVLAGLCSCSVNRVVVPADPRLTEHTARGDRARVVGCTTTDGRYHRFVAYVTVVGDSLVLTRPAVPPAISGGGGSPESVIVLPRAEVRSLRLYGEVSGFLTVLAVLVGGLGILLIVAYVSLQNDSLLGR